MPELSAPEFVEKWAAVELNERQTYVSHFNDLCRLVGHAMPLDQDRLGHEFVFEKSVRKTSGEQGYADVWYRGHFAFEYKTKGKYKTLDEAYQQLQQYREDLQNPRLMVVCDIENWEIHTNWPDTEKQVYRFKNGEILKADVQHRLNALFYAPEKLRPNRSTEEVTIAAAAVFEEVVNNMRDEWEAEPERIAHFLTKLIFCLFAEDIDLLPAGPHEKGIFSEIVQGSYQNRDNFVADIRQLFGAMAVGGRLSQKDIPYFNGALFEDIDVHGLSHKARAKLWIASGRDWASMNPSIFGTLFERTLDPKKRAQLGAHYTSKDDILLIVEPVLMTPLKREWEAVKMDAAPIRAQYEAAATPKAKLEAENKLAALRERILERLHTVTVLDPACGSGNFLYVALQQLMDFERAVIKDALWTGLEEPELRVHPRQLYGIEKDPIAHALASIVVWIGFLQWRWNNGYRWSKRPILENLRENIVNKDAIMAFDSDGKPVEPEWPTVDVIVGNPPFLGGNRVRAELGDYVDKLFKLYEGRVPAFADLVTYWFEKARAQIESGKVKRAGLLSTNSIRGGANREVLKRIKETGDIFMAWADRDWVNEGVGVRVSMVGFDRGEEKTKSLDGLPAENINSDLTAEVDLTKAVSINQNQGIAFRGNQKGGAFDISAETAAEMIESLNKSGRSNQEVVKICWNGDDITSRPRNKCLIDFGVNIPLEEAELYEAPLAYVREHVKPNRDKNPVKQERENWWLSLRTRPMMRDAIKPLTRYLVTPHTSKHRLFVWLSSEIIPDHALIAIARADDYFFGVLHSKLHEVWSLRMGTSLEDRPRYTPTTTFETFPFPWPPGHEDTASAAYTAISAAAKSLHKERDAWLNPPDASAATLKKRTLTNLYNALQVVRGAAKSKVKIETDAGEFAWRLAALHDALDAAVCAAYGWPVDILKDEDDMLRRLLALNLERE